MHIFKILLFVFFTTLLNASTINIDKNTKFENILTSSETYIDETKSLSLDEILKKDIKFEKNTKSLLAYGYSPDFDVWIKFTLKNTSDKQIEKLLEYDNPLTTDISFYDISSNSVTKEGLFNISKNRNSLTPIFRINLKPNESKTFYIKASSYVTTLIVKLNIWDVDEFYSKEIKRQLILALFFGSMFVLAIYNLSIYSFTRDISYLFYVLYIFGTMLHHSLYVGIINIYLLDYTMTGYSVKLAPFIIAFPIFALALFTKSFLRIKKYPIHNKILTFFIVSIILSVLFFVFNDQYDKYRNILPVLLSLYLVYLTIYTAIKRNRQAYFILSGWIIIFIAIIIMNLSSTGIFNIYEYFSYVIEVAFILEALIFSVALADRIKQLQYDKNEANIKLIKHQKNQRKILKEKVDEKTKDLKIALDEKKLLLQELNHRVKNNMQTIMSLIRLQTDEIEDEKIHGMFLTIQNRINAMSHLHDLLYMEKNILNIDAEDYFSTLIDELRHSYDNTDINISLDIQTQLPIEDAIYCGLIVNELLTNSFKYAFEDGMGDIKIKLIYENGIYELFISDNGKGYSEENINSNSLGLLLVDTLAVKQLKGDVTTNSTSGVTTLITWRNN